MTFEIDDEKKLIEPQKQLKNLQENLSGLKYQLEALGEERENANKTIVGCTVGVSVSECITALVAGSFSPNLTVMLKMMIGLGMGVTVPVMAGLAIHDSCLRDKKALSEVNELTQLIKSLETEIKNLELSIPTDKQPERSVFSISNSASFLYNGNSSVNAPNDDDPTNAHESSPFLR